MVLKCKQYNYNTSTSEHCQGSYEKCAKDIYCGDDKSESRQTCFVVWDPSSNLTSSISAGCLPDDPHSYNSCNNRCIGQQRGKRFYCCCNQDNCNERYELPAKLPLQGPNTQSSSSSTVTVQEPKPSNLIWPLPFIIIVVTITLIGGIYYGYNRRRRRRRKHTSNWNDGLSDFPNLTSRELDELDHQNLHHLTHQQIASQDASFVTRLRNTLVPSNLCNYSSNGNNIDYLDHNGQLMNKRNNIMTECDYNALISNNKTNRSHRQLLALNGGLVNDNQHSGGQQVTTRFGDFQLTNGLHNVTSYTHDVDIKNLKVLEEIGSGRFGTVRRATMTSGGDNQIIAVKIIPASEQNSWLNEIKVYSSTKARHPNILGFLGSHEDHRGENNTITSLSDQIDGYWLLVDYASNGSLYDYLREKTVDWNEFTRISLGIVHGLSHLHDADIAHRDFKSKNVLLKHDLTPCITDFGVAAILDPAPGSQMDHRKRFLQVGTPRYMAPEVLECSVTFTKTSFTKIDVYALSLVLWELLSRCNPLYQQQSQQMPQQTISSSNNSNINHINNTNTENSPLSSEQTTTATSITIEHEPTGCPPYMLPFEDVAGQNPSINTMRQIVVTDKLRPPIKQRWRLYPVSEFCRAIEDGWEYDHDARISASCFVERLESLQHGSDI